LYLEGVEYLPEGAGCVLLAVVSAFDDSLEEFTAGDQFEHQLDLGARLEHLAQADLTIGYWAVGKFKGKATHDVGVPKFQEHADLGLRRLPVQTHLRKGSLK